MTKKHSDLSSFETGASALVIGASGGIGQAFVRHLKQDPNFETVLTASRSAGAEYCVDITKENDIKALAKSIRKRTDFLDLVIVATGILHDGNNGYDGQAISPEKALRHLSYQAMLDVMAVNCVGPALAMRYLSDWLPKDRKSVFASLSARVGSISDNHLGGWYSYRASKAALNMVIKTASIEFARSRPQMICVGLHPGTVDTTLSEPFQASVPDGKLFSPDHAAGLLLSVIGKLQPKDSGGCFDYTGERIPS